jgi:hypothetical protein
MYCGPVFEWLKTRWPILPFENQTQIVSGKSSFEYRTVWFSDGDCITKFGTVCKWFNHLKARLQKFQFSSVSDVY